MSVAGRLEILGPCTTVLQQPVSSLNNCPGTTVQFTYRVESVPNISRQWRRNGSPLIDGPTPWGSIISGATAETLTIANVRPSAAVGPGGDSDTYDCVVTSPIGLCTSATSDAATLSVRDGVPTTPCAPPPTFTLQPQSVTITSGGSASFNVSADTTCIGRYKWEWRDATSVNWTPLQPGFNALPPTMPNTGNLPYESSGGLIVSGEQTDVLFVQTLNLRPGSGAAAAAFRCVVSDDCATAFSNTAVLIINPIPTPPVSPPVGACCNPFTGVCTASTAAACPAGAIFAASPSTCASLTCTATGVSCCAGSTCTVILYGPCQNTGIIVASCAPENCPTKLGVCCNPITGACSTTMSNNTCDAGLRFVPGAATCGAFSPCPTPTPPGTNPPIIILIPIPPVGACCLGASCAVTYSVPACTLAGGRLVIGAACNAVGNDKTPCCKADFNQNGSVNVADIFAFLSAWFAADPRSDFNASGVRDVADIFAFLSAWFAGC